MNGLYCKIFIHYLQYYNLQVSEFKLFTILSLLFIKLQVAIPDYKNYKMGGRTKLDFLI